MLTRNQTDQICSLAADISLLQRAWASVRAAGGGAGVDRQTIDAFAAKHEQYLVELIAQLQRGYRFSRLRQAVLPKANGKLRKLGIPTVRDRIVLQATRLVIEPACEAKMLDCSHAYRPGRGAMTAIAAVSQAIADGANVVLETDIQTFFDSIRHRNLLSQLASMEPRVQHSRLIAASLTLSSSMWPARKGVAQGSPLSPLLANVALTGFDRAMLSKHWTMVRYADDLIVLCRSAEHATQAETRVRKELGRIGLTMHPDKTKMIDSRQQSFAFLGFEIHPDRLVPDSNNLARLRDNIAAWCNPHSQENWEARIQQINALMRSFAWYYHQTDSTRLFWTLDQFVYDSLVELEAQIGSPKIPWQNQLVKMAQMREVSWKGKGKGKRKSRGWNGYGR